MSVAGNRPNLLILMSDQLKASAIRLYGNPDVDTPSLERLASRGILYRQHYVTAPMCVPSRAAFWTGMYPHCTGVRHNQVLMPAGGNHFARLLDEAGYTLALIGKDHCFQGPDRARFAYRYDAGHQGVQDSDAHEDAPRVATFLRSAAFSERAVYCATIPYAPDACSTNLIARRALEFLERQNNESSPFCAWVSFPDPHHPLAAPEPYASMYPWDRIAMPPTREGELDNKMERQRVFYHLTGLDTTSEDDLRRAVSMYYGMIRFLDDGIGAVLDGLERLGLSENTIVIFTSDHGDYAGEHRMMLKSGTFYDCMTRVPLIISWPNELPRGELRDELVSQIDIMPTVMSMLGVPVPEPVYGRLLPGAGGESQPRSAVFAEHGAGGPAIRMPDLAKYPDYTEPQPSVSGRLMHARNAEGRPKMVRTRRWKYVYDPMDPVDESYDMQEDPWELSNVATNPENARVRQDLRDELMRWSIMTEDHVATPLYSDPDTLSDTADGGPDYYYHPLAD